MLISWSFRQLVWLKLRDRLAELSRLKRKYGGTIDSALEHLARAQDRLLQIETSDERQKQLELDLEAAYSHFMDLAGRLRKERLRAAKKFEQAVEKGIAEVAMENARFQAQVSDRLQFVGDSSKDQIGTYW